MKQYWLLALKQVPSGRMPWPKPFRCIYSMKNCGAHECNRCQTRRVNYENINNQNKKQNLIQRESVQLNGARHTPIRLNKLRFRMNLRRCVLCFFFLFLGRSVAVCTPFLRLYQLWCFAFTSGVFRSANIRTFFARFVLISIFMGLPREKKCDRQREKKLSTRRHETWRWRDNDNKLRAAKNWTRFLSRSLSFSLSSSGSGSPRTLTERRWLCHSVVAVVNHSLLYTQRRIKTKRKN